MKRDKPGVKALRKGRVSISGQIYFVTKCAKIRIPEEMPPEIARKEGLLLFADVPEIITSVLNWLVDAEMIDLIAYVIMPDHVHLLFKLGNKSELSAVMHQFCGKSAKEAYKLTNMKGGLWEVGFYDHAVRETDNLNQIISYIQQNPLKRGLVEEDQDWLWYWAI